MPTYTKYKKIEKPLALEWYSIDVVNKNNDIIDSELHKLELKNESQDNLLATKEALNVEASRATTRENALDDNLSGEISRAQSAEIKIINSLESEVNRATTAEAAIRKNLSDHNISDSSHNDMRLLISGLTERLNALADSDDTTLDQLSEIVAYIKNNKSLIENVTTSKVDVSDIIDSLTSTATNKPLSAKQGMVLKDLIDALTTTVGNKVDKVSGKGLSTNDYTTTEKNKLDGIASGAEVNVQSDWNITDPTSDAYIKNKPTAMPASDVPAWAKENTKPSYTKEDVGLGKVPNVSTNDQTPTFTEAEERENISSGDSTSTLWGKVKKWFSDMKDICFSGKYKDLDEKPYVNGLQMVDGNHNYVVCDTPATEATKILTIPGFKTVKGAAVYVLFSNGAPTNTTIPLLSFKINDEETVYPVYNLTEPSASAWGSSANNRIFEFIFTGTRWILPDERNTWKLNTKTSEGYVAKGSGHPNQVWSTDANGTPGWKEISSGVYSEIPSVNGLQMSDGNTDFVVCSNAATEKNKTVTKSGWTSAEGSRIRILFKNGCTVASNLQVMPGLLSLALVKNTKKDPFLTNETGVIYEFTFYNAMLVLTGSTGGGVDPSDITPSSIGAVAKTGDKMTGRLEIKTPSASPTAAKLVTGDEGNQRIFYGSDSIESVTPGNEIGILKLNPEGNGNNGRVVTGSPLHVAGGLSVDNALGNVFANMRDFRFLPVFNGYTGDAGTGGIFGYLERKACGLAPFWHWTTSGNYEGYYYKITVGAKDVDAGNLNWMISFDLSVYQSYAFCKFAISGYLYYIPNEDGSYELVWYEPRAMMITGDYKLDARNVYFGKDTDGHLYIAINALAYTGLVIDAVNVAYQDIVVDYSSLFSLSVEPTLDNTTKYSTQLVYRPFYLDEANELKNSVSNGKAMVASAITAKGVYTAADATFATMADNIANINNLVDNTNPQLVIKTQSILSSVTNSKYSFTINPNLKITEYCHLYIIYYGILSSNIFYLEVNGYKITNKKYYFNSDGYMNGIGVNYGYFPLESDYDIIGNALSTLKIQMAVKNTTLSTAPQYFPFFCTIFYK